MGFLDSQTAKALIWQPAAAILARAGAIERVGTDDDLRLKEHPAWDLVFDEIMFRFMGKEGILPEDQNYEAFLKSVGFFSWVQSCVKAIGWSAAAPPLYAQDPNSGEFLDDHPLVERLMNPNPQDGYFAFWNQTMQQLNMTGEAFWGVDGDVANPKDIQFWLLRSDRVGVMPSSEDAFPVDHYTYRNANGKVKELAPEQVIHFKFPHPTDLIHGLSPLHELRMTLSLLWNALNWNKDFFKNGARLSGLLKLPSNQTMGMDEFNRTVDQLKKRHAEEGKRHKTMVLEGGADWIETGTSPKEADFLELLSTLRNEVHAVYRVPPNQSGILEYASYANAKSMDAQFWRGTIQPVNRFVLDHLNAQPVVLIHGVKLVHDYEGVDALREDEDAQSNRDAVAVANGTRTINEIREERGYGDPVPWGFAPQWAVQAGLVDIEGNPIEEEEEEVEDEPTPVPPTEDEEQPESSEDEPEPGESPEEMAAANQRIPEGWRSHPVDKSARAQRWQEYQNRIAALERGFVARARSMFVALQKEVLANLNLVAATNLGRKAKDSDPVPDSWVDQTLFRIGFFQRVADEKLAPQARRAYAKGGNDLLQMIQNDGFFDVDSDEAKTFLKTWTSSRIDDMSKSQARSMKRLIRNNVRDGGSVGDLKKSIRSHFRTMRKSRAALIARTETTGLYSAGLQDGMKQEGVQFKEWLATPDDLTRDSHAEADGQRVPVGADFVLAGGSGPYPGAINGSGENENCRCTMIPVVGG